MSTRVLLLGTVKGLGSRGSFPVLLGFPWFSRASQWYRTYVSNLITAGRQIRFSGRNSLARFWIGWPHSNVERRNRGRRQFIPVLARPFRTRTIDLKKVSLTI